MKVSNDCGLSTHDVCDRRQVQNLEMTRLRLHFRSSQVARDLFHLFSLLHHFTDASRYVHSKQIIRLAFCTVEFPCTFEVSHITADKFKERIFFRFHNFLPFDKKLLRVRINSTISFPKREKTNRKYSTSNLTNKVR